MNIVDHRLPSKNERVDCIKEGGTFEWNHNIYIVTGGADHNSVECCHLGTGHLHNILDYTVVELVDLEIHIRPVS